MGRWRRGYKNGKEERDHNGQKEGYRETVGGRRFQSCWLTLIVAPESLILGFLGIEVF